MNQDRQHTSAKEPIMSVRQLLRQQRELEEKRKFGLAPLAVDCATQQEISPNVPQSISQAPWFYGATGPTLEHHRQRDRLSDDVLHDQPTQVAVLGRATKYVAGSCKNCGSRTHKAHECTQARKKVGAVYSGKVTGVDLNVQSITQSYAQKRDRYVGDLGVDLMQQSYQEETNKDDDDDTTRHAQPPATDLSTRDPASELAKRAKVDGVFHRLTSQHGGVEIKELPKYLQNIDSQDHILFDPKTGSMRGNPHEEENASHVFRGDLERYRSGDYYHYIETQYRFLTGQSKSFVDFDYDAKLSGLDAQTAPPASGGVEAEAAPSSSPPRVDSTLSVEEKVVQSLYGIKPSLSSAAPTTEEAAQEPLSHGSCSTIRRPNEPQNMHTAEPTNARLDATTAHGCASGDLACEPPQQESARAAGLGDATVAPRTVLWTRRTHSGQAIPAGHEFVYGSYFCPARFQWGYKCCKGIGYNAPACVN